MGRNRHYSSPDEFDAAVDCYVDNMLAQERPLTWTGLALALGFSCRSSIDEYIKYDGFSYSVKRAKLLVEASYEERLYSTSTSGIQFALKNLGWSDKTQVDHTTNGQSFKPMSLDDFYDKSNTDT